MSALAFSLAGMSLFNVHRTALAEDSGTIVGPDRRGKHVLAAYQPVVERDFDTAAKNGFEEILKPFNRVVLWAGGIALAIVLLGTPVFWFFTHRLLRRLKENEAKYRGIFENNPNSIFLLSDVYDDCNQQACRFLGYCREEIVGHSPGEFSPPLQPGGRDSAEAAKKVIDAALAGKPQFLTWQYRRKDGKLLDAEVFLKTIEVEGRKLNLVISRDVTERKQMEAALRASEERFRSVFEFSLVGIGIANLEGEFLEANRAFCRFLGFSEKELLKQPLLNFTHTDDREKTTLALDELIGGQRPWIDYEKRYVRKDGAVVWGHTTVSLAYDANENPLRLVGLVQDITDRKRAEEEILKLNQELEARVIERTRELELATQEMEAFTYSVSHDLRAPLRAIGGFSEALLEDYAEKLDEDGKKYLRYLQEGSQDMSDLIDGLLKLSRSTRGEMAREPVELSLLVTGVVKELRQAEPDRQVTVHIAENVKADADPRLLKAVMENLLGNAWKYTAQTADASIEFGAEQQDGETVFFVRDNGAGFDMAYADKLFLPFQRLHKTAEYSGTGIGLATVERIIHRHGGRVWAKGAVGEGATFYFTLEPERNLHG